MYYYVLMTNAFFVTVVGSAPADLATQVSEAAPSSPCHDGVGSTNAHTSSPQQSSVYFMFFSNYLGLNFYSAGIDFKRQILTAKIDPQAEKN